MNNTGCYLTFTIAYNKETAPKKQWKKISVFLVCLFAKSL